MTGLALDGQQVAAAGQSASATSTNNFINFCATRSDLPLTNGAQVKTGSCNQTPLGVILAQNQMPSTKFAVPANLDTIPADQTFNVVLNVRNTQLGVFTNAASNYYAGPQNTNSAGQLVGHTHLVIETLTSLTQTTPLNPEVFAFFKGIDQGTTNGAITQAVTGGLPAGAYRICSITSSSNHQPALVAVAQHGNIDDCVYFQASTSVTSITAGTITPAGAAGTGTGAGTANGGGNVAAAVSSSTTPAAGATTTNAATAATGAGKGATGGKGAGGKGAGDTTTTTKAAAAVTTTAAGKAGAVTTTATANGAGKAGVITTSAAAATTATGANLQTFKGTLGGSAAPPVVAGGKGFLTDNASFVNVSAALQRSCSVQNNACANAANASGNKAPLTVAACNSQNTACQAA
jgi:hypothetical protein